MAAARGIQDTSRQGRYHNRRFAALAAEVGVQVAQDPRLGWSPSTLADGTAEVYHDQVADLTAALVAYRHPEPQGGRDKNASSGNGVVAVCACPQPRRIRVRSAEMFEAAPILCGACRQPFEATD